MFRYVLKRFELNLVQVWFETRHKTSSFAALSRKPDVSGFFRNALAPILALGLTGVAPVAQAQVACAARDQLIEGLASKFGEERIAGGLQSANKMVEVFSSPETGSFTILLTQPDGQSCIVSSGKSWNTFKPAEVPAGSKV